MRKFLSYVGGIAICLVVGFIALLFWAQRAGSAHQETFFAAVLSGEPEQVLALFHPTLREEVDAPVLKSWMVKVGENLGSFKGLSKTHFNTSTKIENGIQMTTSEGTVEFEKGQAQSEIGLAADQIIKFQVQSEKIPTDWFHGPASTDLYRTKANSLIERLMTGKVDDAYQMMHPALQKELPLENLKREIGNLSKKAGAIKTISFKSEKLDPSENYSLEQLFDLTTENGTLSGEVKFGFDGLKGHILAFNIQPTTLR